VQNRTSYSKARGYPDASSDAQTDASIDASLMHQWCRGRIQNLRKKLFIYDYVWFLGLFIQFEIDF
jgi:hypothetical protein